MVAADRAVDAQDAAGAVVLPAQLGMHVGEEHPGAAAGQLSGSVGHVGLGDQANLWPEGPDRELPVGRQERADPVAQGGRLLGEQGVREGVRGVGGEQVAGDGRGRGPADDGEFVSEGRLEDGGPRGEEVREGQPVRDQGAQQLPIECAEAGQDRAVPGQVEGRDARVPQDAQAQHGLAERREGEPGIGEVLDAELEADH